jgi:hypothetical protein
MDLSQNFMSDFWMLALDTITWIQITNIGEAPSPRYSMASTIYGSRLVIFGGLNDKTYNSSDLYICELDPMVSRQIEVENDKK